MESSYSAENKAADNVKKQTLALITKFCARLQKVCHMEHWDIALSAEDSGDDLGLCWIGGSYHRGRINIQPELVRGRQHIVRIFCHEFAHLLLHPIEMHLTPYFDQGKANRFKQVYTSSVEQAVTIVGRALEPYLKGIK